MLLLENIINNCKSRRILFQINVHFNVYLVVYTCRNVVMVCCHGDSSHKLSYTCCIVYFILTDYIYIKKKCTLNIFKINWFKSLFFNKPLSSMLIMTHIVRLS